MQKKNLIVKSSKISIIKNKLKELPFIYSFCRFILNPGFRFYPARRNKYLKDLIKKEGCKVLNIGSGTVMLSKAVINLDISAFKGVDIISNAHVLPFKTEVFDGLLLESLLEHVKDPGLVVKEAFRVLKKGGLLFVELPFMYEFHQAPADYYRFTLSGIEILCKDFKKIDSGIDIGPTGTLNAVLRNYFSIIFSFGNTGLYEILNMFFGIVLFPLKFLDFIMISLKNSSNISSVLYFIGRKNNI